MKRVAAGRFAVFGFGLCQWWVYPKKEKLRLSSKKSLAFLWADDYDHLEKTTNAVDSTSRTTLLTLIAFGFFLL